MNKQLSKFLKRYWIVPLIAIKSAFQGFVQVIWGLVGLAFLGGAVAYFDQQVPNFIFQISGAILDNIDLLIWIFTIIFFSFEFLEWQKLTAKQKPARAK